MGYDPSADFDAACACMRETGIDGVQLNAATPDQYRKAVAIARKYSIEVYAWVVTMNVEKSQGLDQLLAEHPDWFSINRRGESLTETKAYVDYYKFLCPALPEVREFIKRRVRAFCEVDGLNGISIDYHRFVDAVLPTTLWPKYGVVQDREYPQWDYGYHPAMIAAFKKRYGYDPRDQEDPSRDEAWLNFRCEQITELANEIADLVHSYGKVMAASPFPTPKMARAMVRQDWGKWNLDIVFPMVYHDFYTEDAGFIADCTMENLQEKKPETALYCGLMITDTLAVTELMDAALNNGAEGISIFTIDSIRSPEVRAAFRSYADAVRSRRAASGYQAPVPKSAVRDPFAKEGVMRLIHQKMREYTKGRDLRLGEYRLCEEFGVAKRYEVSDANSGLCFTVTFYFYGGILSGWIVHKKL
jgi:hypothetical protein